MYGGMRCHLHWQANRSMHGVLSCFSSLFSVLCSVLLLTLLGIVCSSKQARMNPVNLTCSALKQQTSYKERRQNTHSAFPQSFAQNTSNNFYGTLYFLIGPYSTNEFQHFLSAYCQCPQLRDFRTSHWDGGTPTQHFMDQTADRLSQKMVDRLMDNKKK